MTPIFGANILELMSIVFIGLFLTFSRNEFFSIWLLVLRASSAKPSGQMARLEDVLSTQQEHLNHPKGEAYVLLTKDAESTLILFCFVLFFEKGLRHFIC